ncbi:HdeD family acid-resistance protein [Tanticharoenia sakaeratensis]|jgi:uncharacterized membrane protein HdeD (DUF308 family)|uniref:Protein hdeD n=1 Tax=Tanticharoenia sakaeratensis NBRC 103193 TaxID=1231623 RepID=A0A0D6MIF4_9PROT|nr:HdeD family acid-resistance protein [Tanticharoenia sakaeratensis]GAN53235.1 protein hdeD [Tanticharoenia sakaeratensis NBRC 103193]GBQ21226.1 hypothetical protein AA103193_1657 [Tanticharoenia sakaeratensis NBRC 103193]
MAIYNSDRWTWFVGLGVASIVLGVLAWIDAMSVSLASVMLLGIAIVVAGIFQIAHAISARDWSGRLFALAGGCLYVLGGVLLMAEPVAGSIFITAVISICMMIAGVARLAIAFSHRETGGWQLMALGGVVTLLIGILLYTSLPWSGLWLIGTFVAVELIIAGVAWLQLGLAMRPARSIR